MDDSTLIADPNLTIEQGAVAQWRSLMWSVMVDVCREMGVRTDVPYKDLTAREKEIVLHGPAEKRHIMYHLKKQNRAVIADPNLTIEQGAVAPWRSLMWSVMVDVCREMGVRTDVPYKDLTDREKEIVLHGPAEKRHIMYHLKKQNRAGEMDFTFFSAARTVLNALDKAKDAKGLKRVEPFIKESPCPDCHGTRLNERARTLPVHGKTLPEQCAMQLDELAEWVQTVPSAMPADMREMAQAVVGEFTRTARRLLELGLGYLTLDRAGSTLSTGERQRIQLARAVRSELTGAMYVLDEPSIGLHPANVDGLLGVMRDLKAGSASSSRAPCAAS